MVSIDDQILIAVRAWLKEATDLPADQIVPADDSGTRPDLPYITVQIVSSDIPAGWDERVWSVNDITGDLDQNIIGRRRGSVQIDGYGRGAYDQLSQAGLSLRLTPIRRLLRNRKLSVRKEGGIQDVSQLVDDEIEKRFTRDFAISYAVTYADAIEDAAPGMDRFEGVFEFNDQEFTVIANDQ